MIASKDSGVSRKLQVIAVFADSREFQQFEQSAASDSGSIEALY